MFKRNNKFKSAISENEGYFWEYIANGTAEPTIIFEAGLGDGLKVWHPLISKLNNLTRTFAYNRAGYGNSSSSTQKERNGSAIVGELRSLLRTLNYKPPYILVGHSLGAVYMEIFAQTHPEEVCGLVLIDPMTIEMEEICKRDNITEWERIPMFKKILLSFFLPRIAKQELAMSKSTLSQVRGSSTCSCAFPVVIISAGKSMWSNRLQDAWMDSQALLAKRYPGCCHMIEKESGHYIQTDNPGFVAARIVSLLKQVSVKSALTEKPLNAPSRNKRSDDL